MQKLEITFQQTTYGNDIAYNDVATITVDDQVVFDAGAIPTAATADITIKGFVRTTSRGDGVPIAINISIQDK